MDREGVLAALACLEAVAVVAVGAGQEGKEAIGELKRTLAEIEDYIATHE